MFNRQAMKSGIKYFLLSIVLLSIVVVLSVEYLHHDVRTKTRIDSPDGIDSLEKVTLGGIDQWILVRGQDKTNPVLLFLHGGPASVLMPYHRLYHTELEEHFTVVHWDQRGAGKSFSSDIPIASMSLTQIVSDARELTELLIERFDIPKIYLIGHSWGTQVGTIVVSQSPELFFAYIGMGQVVDSYEDEVVSYDFAVDKARELGNEEITQKLETMGPPPLSLQQSSEKWSVLLELGAVVHSPDLSVIGLMKIGLTSPDYSLADWVKMVRGTFFSIDHIASKPDYTHSFTRDIPRLEVPVYFLAGRYDYLTPSVGVEAYYDLLDAPAGKQLLWFEDSAHMPLYEEPAKFMSVLIDTVLKETYHHTPN